MQKASRLVGIRRQIKGLDAEVTDLKKDAAALEAELLVHMENGEFPTNARIDGATVSIKRQVWAGPKNGDHKVLAQVLYDLGLTEYVPKTVNTQSLSGYIREQLDDDKLKAIEDRLNNLDPRLRDVLNVTERVSIQANGL